MNQLIRCVTCDKLFLKTPFDEVPEYPMVSEGSALSSSPRPRDDLKIFLRNHQGHPIEELEIFGDSFASEEGYLEPVKVSYFKATNGKERFVVKKFRERIEDPLSYKLIFGDYFLRCTGIEVQGEAIACQLKSEFRESPLTAAEVASFVKLYERIAEVMEVETLERLPYESSHPLEVYCKPDDVSVICLLRNARNLFKGAKYSQVEAFIRRQKDDGVLLVKVTYRIEVQEKARPVKNASPSGLPLSNEGVGA